MFLFSSVLFDRIVLKRLKLERPNKTLIRRQIKIQQISGKHLPKPNPATLDGGSGRAVPGA